MESDCCGASEWMPDTGICGDCKEHADWNDEEEEDTNWVLLEEGYPVVVLLTETEAKEILVKYIVKNPHLGYSLFYDKYYEFNEITKTN
jgi:hypothetical protein